MNVRIKNKIDSQQQWEEKNTVLLSGEIGIEEETRNFKIGDGTTPWNDLPYVRAKVSEEELIKYALILSWR